MPKVGNMSTNLLMGERTAMDQGIMDYLLSLKA